MNREDYLRQLRQRLRFRAAARQRVDDIAAEVETHLAESGEDPLETFGPPDRYAAQLLPSRWHTARYLVGVAVAVGAGLLLGATATAVAAGEATVSVPGGSVLVAASVILAGTVVTLPLVHNRLPSLPLRLGAGVGVAVLGTCASAVVGTTTGLDERVLLTLSLPGTLAASLGLIIVAVAIMAGPYILRRLRRS